ncbi:MAG TPA: hypothetical protein PK095_13710 [Myxococcota bacterium]|nr:hypothetical protein [Myxococcota bacterium]
MAVLAACGGDPDYGEILDAGTGTANTRPLWPLASGVLAAHVNRESSVMPVQPPWQVLVSQRPDPEGRLVTVSLRSNEAVLADTLDLLETKRGDLVAIEPDGRRYLMVPATVRVGMRWRAEIPALPGAWSFAYQGASGSKRRGGPEWTFEVQSREVVEGPLGSQVVWTIVGAGPKVPHVEEDGKACYGIGAGALDAIFCTVKSPLENVPRQSVTWRFAEGLGPLRAHGEPGGHEAIQVGGSIENVVLPELTGDLKLAGSAAADLPTIALSALPMSDELEAALDEEVGVFMGQSARFTASSTELAEGHAAELVLFGSGYLATRLDDPNGQRIDDWVIGRAALCLALDEGLGGLVPLERLADTCPDRVGPNPNSRGQLAFGSAQPYVTPAGRWWARADIERMPGSGGDPINGTFERKGLETQAPFIHEGVLHSLNCYGEEPDSECSLIAFPDENPVLMESTSAASGFVTGVYVWGSRPAAKLLVGGGDGVRGGPPSPAIRFALAHDKGFIHVSAHRPRAIIRWFSLDGRMLDHRTVPIWQPTIWHRDGRYELYDVRPLGELHRVVIGPDPASVESVEVLGRLALPRGERAEAAFPRDDGRFVVVTSRPAGDGKTGMALPSPYESGITPYGVVPAIPSSYRKTLRFHLSAVPKGDHRDLVSAGLALPFWQTGPVLSFCDGDGLSVSALWVGGEELEVSDTRDRSGCHHMKVPDPVDAAAREVGLLPVAFSVDGVGVFHRPVPWSAAHGLAEPDAGEGPEETTATLATLPTRMDRYAKSLRPTASDAVCSLYSQYQYQAPGFALRTCRFEPWGRPETTVSRENTLAVCDGSTPCLDLLAFEGDTSVFSTHDWWVASPDNPWVRGRPDLFPPDRIYWVPRERPEGPLVAADFENAVPLDRLGRHWRVVIDLEGWRLPNPYHESEPDPTGGDGGLGPWVEPFGQPIVEDVAFDPAPLLEGTGLPAPLQRWSDLDTTLEVFGPPVSRWLKTELVATPRRAVRRWTSGPVPDGVGAAIATDGEHILWERGPLDPLSGSPVVQPEVCNGLDDDGDGTDDEAGVELCPDPDAVMSCQDGVCFRSGCVAGRAACDDNPSRCDVVLGTLDDCLGCGDACPKYGGSECATTGCTRPKLTEIVAVGESCWRHFETGEWLDGEVRAGEWTMVAGGGGHVCRLDAAGGLTCECVPEGNPCRGAGLLDTSSPPVYEGLGPFDRVWSHPGSTCVRRAEGGAIHCWGAVMKQAIDDNFELRFGEIAELAGATAIVFGGLWSDNAYALVGGEVFVFGLEPVGASWQWRVEKVGGVGSVTAVHAAQGYALFETAEGAYGLGLLGRFSALNGPSARRWDVPTRAPGLDGALQLLATDGGPCIRTATGIRCAYEAGNYGLPPAGWTKLSAPYWLELAGAFQAAGSSGSRLCVARDDLPATVLSETFR